MMLLAQRAPALVAWEGAFFDTSPASRRTGTPARAPLLGPRQASPCRSVRDCTTCAASALCVGLAPTVESLATPVLSCENMQECHILLLLPTVLVGRVLGVLGAQERCRALVLRSTSSAAPPHPVWLPWMSLARAGVSVKKACL